MAIYIKVNNTEYPAVVNGMNNDRTWDGRDTHRPRPRVRGGHEQREVRKAVIP